MQREVGERRLTVLAAAKINLHLRVGPVQPNGYHPLLTWMVTVGLFDRLTFEYRSTGAPEEIQFSCDDPTLPGGEGNLVVRAARSLASAAPVGGHKRGATRIHLEKRIPHAAGLGGGSADASRTLEALRELWSLQALSRSAVYSLAAELGSDVPFFLHGPSSVCRGRGEIVVPTAPPAVARWVLLMLPQIALSTAAVYREFDRQQLGRRGSADGGGKTESDARGLGKAHAGATRSLPRPPIAVGSETAALASGAEAGEPVWQEWTHVSAASLLPRLVNDLEPPAFALAPQLAALRVQLEQTLGRIVRMSGSGSSLFTLFDSQAEAQDAAKRIGSTVRAVAVELAPNIADDLSRPGSGDTSVVE